MAENDFDYVVVGGGMIGSAIGFGLVRQGLNCAVLDADDRDFRAARGNFGLVWVQSKGADFSEYARWTRRSRSLWPSLAEELQQRTGIDVQYQRTGGIHYCLDDIELQQREALLRRLADKSDGEFNFQMLDHKALKELEPNVGPTIPGGSWSPHDGHANPLYLLRALQAAFIAGGGRYLAHHRVKTITRQPDGFRLDTASGEVRSRKLILAAGLDNARLAPLVGMQQPVHPQRGQVLITERLPPLMNYPSNYLRQTAEGTVQIGDTKESVGFDDGQTVEAMARLASRACRIIPALGRHRVVRGWGALRVLSGDGYPIYESAPDAWAFSSHSGVTLAAAHAMALGPMLQGGGLSPDLTPFSSQRFQG